MSQSTASCADEIWPCRKVSNLVTATQVSEREPESRGRHVGSEKQRTKMAGVDHQNMERSKVANDDVALSIA